MDSICDYIPERFSQFHGYHRNCYQRFSSNLSRLIPQQRLTPEDAHRARQSRRDSATKDLSIFKPHHVFWIRRCVPQNSSQIYATVPIPIGGAVAQRVERWACDQQVVGSIPTRGKAA